jgi:hypothetical protein
MTMAKAERSPAQELARDMAAIAANVYAALLGVRFTAPGSAVDRFTSEQAFALTRELFYGVVKDEGLL